MAEGRCRERHTSEEIVLLPNEIKARGVPWRSCPMKPKDRMEETMILPAYTCRYPVEYRHDVYYPEIQLPPRYIYHHEYYQL